jgi:hypothetical protein
MQDIATLLKAKFSLRSPEVFRQRLINSGLWSLSSPYLKELDSYNWSELKTRLFFCGNVHFFARTGRYFPRKIVGNSRQGFIRVSRNIFGSYKACLEDRGQRFYAVLGKEVPTWPAAEIRTIKSRRKQAFCAIKLLRLLPC